MSVQENVIPLYIKLSELDYSFCFRINVKGRRVCKRFVKYLLDLQLSTSQIRVLGKNNHYCVQMIIILKPLVKISY